MTALKQKFRNIKKLPDWLYIPLKWILCFYRSLMRIEIVDPENQVGNPRPPAVVVAWHNRLLFLPLIFPKNLRERTAAVTSASRDGQYLTDLLKQFGVESIRGSSRRNGVNVLLDSVRVVEDRKYISLTPDGPRGPKYHMSPGAVYMAGKMGIPVIPVGINYESYWSLRSWDGFRIPKPFSKITLVIGAEVRVPGGLPPEGVEEWRLKLERRLREISGE